MMLVLYAVDQARAAQAFFHSLSIQLMDRLYNRINEMVELTETGRYGSKRFLIKVETILSQLHSDQLLFSTRLRDGRLAISGTAAERFLLPFITTTEDFTRDLDANIDELVQKLLGKDLSTSTSDSVFWPKYIEQLRHLQSRLASIRDEYIRLSSKSDAWLEFATPPLANPDLTTVVFRFLSDRFTVSEWIIWLTQIDALLQDAAAQAGRQDLLDQVRFERLEAGSTAITGIIPEPIRTSLVLLLKHVPVVEFVKRGLDAEGAEIRHTAARLDNLEKARAIASGTRSLTTHEQDELVSATLRAVGIQLPSGTVISLPSGTTIEQDGIVIRELPTSSASTPELPSGEQS